MDQTILPNFDQIDELSTLLAISAQISLQSTQITNLQMSIQTLPKIPTNFNSFPISSFPSIHQFAGNQQIQSANIASQLNEQTMLYNFLLNQNMIDWSKPTISPVLLASSMVSTNQQYLTNFGENSLANQIKNEKNIEIKPSPMENIQMNSTLSFLKDIKKAVKMGGFSPKRQPTICVICSKMSLYNFYGVKCCESCKQFFRRIVVKQTEFFCVRGGNCRIDKGVEKCRGCRMDKCLLAGMDPKLINVPKSDSFYKFLQKLEARRGNLIKKYKKLQQ